MWFLGDIEFFRAKRLTKAIARFNLVAGLFKMSFRLSLSWGVLFPEDSIDSISLVGCLSERSSSCVHRLPGSLNSRV